MNPKEESVKLRQEFAACQKMPTASIKVHILHCGRVRVSKYLPFGGEGCSPVKATGVLGKKRERVWLPASAYLVEHPKGLFLIDTGWERAMSPRSTFDAKAQLTSLGSALLYKTNQGVVECGALAGYTRTQSPT